MSETQRLAILRDLQEGRELSPLEALDRHGCFRLAARIEELRSEGWPIETEIRRVGRKRVAVYSLSAAVQASWL